MMGFTANSVSMGPSAGVEGEERFRAMLETTPECVKLVSLDGTILHMNQSGLAMVGATSIDQVTGKSVYDLIAPDDRAAFQEFNERVCGGEAGSLEFDIVSLTGSRRQMETHANPFRHSDGTTVQLAITRDVTDRKHAERAALLLGSIVDSSEDAILSKDLNGIITSWNNSAERVFGYNAQEAIGQSVARLLIPPDRQGEERDILARLKKGERVEHFETVRKRKDGTLLDISLTISPVKDQSGKITGASKIARDITAQVRAQVALNKANEALRRSNADLEQFAYSASHDLQEPLRMISAYSDLLRKKYVGRLDDTANEYIGYVTEGASRMERLLRDLRAFTYAAVGAEAPLSAIDSNVVLDNTLANLRASIEENNAEITSTSLPFVHMLESQLGQVFQNIIANAIRYRKSDPPKIHVAAVPEGDAWKFSINDNGIGIGPEYKEQVFGIFKRLHTASEYPGTGMGLAICQRIIERAGGRIWVESTLGRGSTFYFILPGAESG